MDTHSAKDSDDVAVLREVLSAVAGRPSLSPVHAAASALLAEFDTTGDSNGSPTAVPPGDIPDVDIPQTTRPRIDQPLGDPLPGSAMQDPSLGILDAELVRDNGLEGTTGSSPVAGADGTVSGSAASGAVGASTGAGFTDKGVPTWDSVRDKVESRSTTALGQEELDHGTPAGRSLDDQWNEREAAGRSKLDEIRRSMKDERPGS